MANSTALRNTADMPEMPQPSRRPFRRLQSHAAAHRIVIVGGGAGGIELATRLGDKMASKGAAHVMLVDVAPAHLWKPLLHEIAAGSLDANVQQLDYVAQARWHHFEFQQGALIDLDRQRKRITVAAVADDDGVEVLPQRHIAYDTLVLAIGSVTHFFDVPGAAEHAFALDSVGQAEQFRRRLIAACMRAGHYPDQPHDSGCSGEHNGGRPRVDIVIIGGGATGVELAAELRNTAEVLGAYGIHHLDPHHDIHITLIEAGPRILMALPEKMARETMALLAGLDIHILTAERVTQVHAGAVQTASDKIVPADLTVWAGGIRVQQVLANVGLPVNKIGQVRVTPTLQVESDPAIFAFGDCAECPWPDKGHSVPPRAQAAHQQATFLYKALRRHLAGKPLPAFAYRDRGSLVSLGRFDAIGNLMGKLIGSTVLIEGFVARLLYAALYRQHLLALHGVVRMLLDTLSQWLRGKTRPRIKLH